MKFDSITIGQRLIDSWFYDRWGVMTVIKKTKSSVTLTNDRGEEFRYDKPHARLFLREERM